MEQHVRPGALFTTADGAWSVVPAEDGRLALSDGGAGPLYIPVEGPLRWVRGDDELSFEQALAAVPAELHGWLALAAVVALRQCLGALVLSVALPPGEQDWSGLAERAGPLADWLNGLAELEGVEIPALPAGSDDGFGDIAAV